MTSDRLLVLPWSALPAWDLKTARAAAFRQANPRAVPLGRFAEEVTILGHPSREPNVEWDVYGVSNTTGVHLSHRQLGRAFNSPYKKIEQDWFFHNPTRANVGSLGRVPAVGPRAVTSPEYQVWRLKGGLDPAFVEILIQSRYFLNLVALHRVGAVKERLFVKNLLEIPIPAFTRNEQAKIVRHVAAARSRSAQMRNKAKVVQLAAEEQLLTSLGLSMPDEEHPPKVLVSSWAEISRWSVRFNRNLQAGLSVEKAKYATRRLSDLITSLQYGTSQKASRDPNGIPVLRIGNVKRGKIATTELKYLRLTQRERQRLLLNDGDILVIRTSGSRELVGTCAVFHEKGEFVFASYLIRLRMIDDVLPDFVASFINSPAGREQVELMSRHIMQNNINADEIGGIQIPIPPLAVQREMVRALRQAMTDVDSLMHQADAIDEASGIAVERALATSDVRVLKG